MKLSERIHQPSFESLSQEAVINLFVASDFLRQKVEVVCDAYGITPSQYNVLRILKGVHPGGHPRFAISERMFERAPDITRLIDRLIKQGLAERYASPEDGRISLARITRKGIRLLEKMKPEINALDNQLAVVLKPAELEALSRLCEKIYSDGETGG